MRRLDFSDAMFDLHEKPTPLEAYLDSEASSHSTSQLEDDSISYERMTLSQFEEKLDQIVGKM